MARRGSFGRLPRSAPDLTSTIVALMREYMAQVNQNYVDAWKNGGKVDGVAVTDARLIAHFKARRDELDTDDPMWAEWDNRVTQYTFAIEDSKMQVKYDNGKVSDSGMAAFYSRWAAKTPDNTEFQRTLLSAAGKFRAAAAARGRAGAAAAGRAKFAADVKNFETKVNSGLSVGTALVAFANETGIGNNAKWLTDIDVAGGGVSDLLDVLKDGSYDLDGNGDLNIPGFDVAAKKLTEDLKKVIPGFSWKNGISQISGALETAATAATKGSKYVKGSKYATQEWTNFFADSKVGLQYTKTAVDNLGPKEDLRINLEKYNDAFEAARGNPFLEDEALTSYLAANKAVSDRVSANTTGNVADPIVTGINNEARNLIAISQGDTEYKPRPDWVGDPNAQTMSGTDKRLDQVRATAAAKKLLEDGGWLSIVGTVDATGNPVMGYSVWPKNVRQGTGSFVLPGAGITGPDGVVYPVYTAAISLDVNVYDQNNNRINVPALKKNPVTGEPIPQTEIDKDSKSPTFGKEVVVYEADGVTPKLLTENADTGIKVIPAVGADGKGYYLYQTTDDHGDPVYTLDPPVVPGVTAMIRMDGGKPVLDYRVDPTMVTPDGKVPVTAAGKPVMTTTTVTETYEEWWSKRGQVGLGPPVTSLQTPQQVPDDGGTGLTRQTTTTGPATAPPPDWRAREQEAIPAVGWFPVDLIDKTITNHNPVTGNLNEGAYGSLTAIQIDHDLNDIAKDDPKRRLKLDAINDRIVNAPVTLQAELDAATKRGDVFGQRTLFAEFNRWQKDLPGITTALTVATTGEDPGKLTSPSNPVNQFFTGVLSAFGITAPAVNGVVDPIRTVTVARATDSDSISPSFGGRPRRPDGTPVATDQNNRALKLPDIGAVLPFLKPLADFISSASVPKLTPSASPYGRGDRGVPAPSPSATAQIGPSPAPKPLATPAPAAPLATPAPTPKPTPLPTPTPIPAPLPTPPVMPLPPGVSPRYTGKPIPF